MRGEYRVLIPLEPKGRHVWNSPKGKLAMEWKRHWDNLLALVKNLKKNGIRYEVEYHLGAEVAYAVVLAGNACRQAEFQLQEAA